MAYFFTNFIFDSVKPYLNGAHVLDLFAGSGMLATEAISLGACKATLIEKGNIAYNGASVSLH